MDYIHRLAAEAHLHECIVLAHERMTSGGGSPEMDESLRTALRNELADLALITGAKPDAGIGRVGDLMHLHGILVNIRLTLDRTTVDKALIELDSAERDHRFDKCLEFAGEIAIGYLGPLAGPLMRERAAKFRDITVTAPEEDAR